MIGQRSGLRAGLENGQRQAFVRGTATAVGIEV